MLNRFLAAAKNFISQQNQPLVTSDISFRYGLLRALIEELPAEEVQSSSALFVPSSHRVLHENIRHSISNPFSASLPEHEKLKIIFNLLNGYPKKISAQDEMAKLLKIYFTYAPEDIDLLRDQDIKLLTQNNFWGVAKEKIINEPTIEMTALLKLLISLLPKPLIPEEASSSMGSSHSAIKFSPIACKVLQQLHALREMQIVHRSYHPLTEEDRIFEELMRSIGWRNNQFENGITLRFFAIIHSLDTSFEYYEDLLRLVNTFFSFFPNFQRELLEPLLLANNVLPNDGLTLRLEKLSMHNLIQSQAHSSHTLLLPLSDCLSESQVLQQYGAGILREMLKSHNPNIVNRDGGFVNVDFTTRARDEFIALYRRVLSLHEHDEEEFKRGLKNAEELIVKACLDYLSYPNQDKYNETNVSMFASLYSFLSQNSRSSVLEKLIHRMSGNNPSVINLYIALSFELSQLQKNEIITKLRAIPDGEFLLSPELYLFIKSIALGMMTAPQAQPNPIGDPSVRQHVASLDEEEKGENPVSSPQFASGSDLEAQHTFIENVLNSRVVNMDLQKCIFYEKFYEFASLVQQETIMGQLQQLSLPKNEACDVLLFLIKIYDKVKYDQKKYILLDHLMAQLTAHVDMQNYANDTYDNDKYVNAMLLSIIKILSTCKVVPEKYNDFLCTNLLNILLGKHNKLAAFEQLLMLIEILPERNLSEIVQALRANLDKDPLIYGPILITVFKRNNALSDANTIFKDTLIPSIMHGMHGITPPFREPQILEWYYEQRETKAMVLDSLITDFSDSFLRSDRIPKQFSILIKIINDITPSERLEVLQSLEKHIVESLKQRTKVEDPSNGSNVNLKEWRENNDIFNEFIYHLVQLIKIDRIQSSVQENHNTHIPTELIDIIREYGAQPAPKNNS